MSKKKANLKIPPEYYNKDGHMDLATSYEQSVAELGLQQSKRDQIIAFYLTILGFVIPNVISLDIPVPAKAVAFLSMYAIGFIFCHVILRYRIYKEVYWIACRVISQLYNIKPEGHKRQVLYALFFHALKNNQSTIVQYKETAGSEKVPSKWRSFRRQLNSAETLMFETLVFFSSFVGAIGAWYLFQLSWALCAVCGLVLILMAIWINYKYTTRLMALYRCIDTELEDDLKATFDKAWMLHCYVDDIIEEQTSL